MRGFFFIISCNSNTSRNLNYLVKNAGSDIDNNYDEVPDLCRETQNLC